jgi:hypothetical protein
MYYLTTAEIMDEECIHEIEKAGERLALTLKGKISPDEDNNQYALIDVPEDELHKLLALAVDLGCLLFDGYPQFDEDDNPLNEITDQEE